MIRINVSNPEYQKIIQHYATNNPFDVANCVMEVENLFDIVCLDFEEYERVTEDICNQITRGDGSD